MGILNRLFGEQPANPPAPAVSSDEEALRRYRYLLRTAPPEAIEQAHAEAFAQLTPEQRARALRELGQAVPEYEKTAASGQADPQSMARMATRAELRQPGILERTFGGGVGGGPSLGGVIGGSLLGSIAGSFIGTAIAHELLGGYDHHSTLLDDVTARDYQGYESAADDGDTVDDARYDEDVDPGDDFGGDDFDGGGFDV
ncbi:hypothetical protein LZC95_02010 [Pendulispora brunnea]|uniref:DUF2076 domain-containing protein n=1 Tax=Pendulispora brunnea TaxID=2905690 RepID=A0ABZ2KDP3_9BACT